MGTDSSIERLLTKDQLTIFRQEKAEFRKQKSTLYSDLKAKGASQMQIDYKISELEEASLTGHWPGFVAVWKRAAGNIPAALFLSYWYTKL